MIKRFLNLSNILNALTIIALLLLPYFIFDGKLFVGGDDTRLYYSYSSEFLKTNFFSWYRFSSLGWDTPPQMSLPLIFIFNILEFILRSKVIIDYLAFSGPLILGFVFFQKFLKEILRTKENINLIVYASSLFYILSPILITNQLFVFLSSAWLIALVPGIFYYFLLYLRTQNFSYIYRCAIFSIIFSLAMLSVPWIAGIFIPVAISLLVLLFFFKKKDIRKFIKSTIFFGIFLTFSQFFWLLGFSMTYLNLSTNSFAAKLFTQGFIDTFTPTVLSTATGSIFLPLLNLFHRQIAFDFGWDLKNIFLTFFDKSLFINYLFVITLFLGISYFKKYLKPIDKKVFLFFAFGFVLSLFLFTVNIGPLKNFFLLLGNVPGFTMFRNFYDKFAPGYVFFYSSLICYCLLAIKNKSISLSRLFSILIIIVMLINFSQVRRIVNAPLWGTNDIYRVVTIPNEYLKFMEDIKQNYFSSNNILSVPFSTSIYSVIKDESTNNVYVGSSPVIAFSGLDDFSGHLSFNFTKEADVFDSLILSSNFNELSKLLSAHNINYIALTKNVPENVKKTWVYDANMLKKQDSNFINQLSSKKVLTSSKGNYELYELKKLSSLISSNNISFQKISPVKYKIMFRNVTRDQKLLFLDSFHSGWKIFPVKKNDNSFCVDRKKVLIATIIECAPDNKFFEVVDLANFWNKSLFNENHLLVFDYANKWIINPGVIKNLDKSYYTTNKDGSINFEVELYFYPQLYFYLGCLITVITLILGLGYLVVKKIDEKHN